MIVRKPVTRSTRIGGQHRTWLYACFVLLFASGALWLGFHYFARAATAIGDAPHPSEAWWMRIHGLAAMLALILFGSLMPVHIRTGWGSGNSRRSGSFMVGVLVMLTLTGYGLYYLVSEDLRAWASVVHWVIGLSLLPIALIHIFYRRQPAAPLVHITPRAQRRQAKP